MDASTAPYPLTTERDDDGSYVVSDDVTLCWGHGDAPEAALADYRETLAEWRDIDRREHGAMTEMATRQKAARG